MFLNNRYQDPDTGVFISVDPLVAKTGEPYLYAAGNPTTLSDPTGLEPGCGATSAKAGKGACAAAHQSADLLSTIAVMRQSEDMAASPVNAWLQQCLYIYSSCRDGTVDPRDRQRGELGTDIAAFFRLTMALIDSWLDAGLVVVGDGGAIVGPNGEVFTARVTFDEQWKLVSELSYESSGCGPVCTLKHRLEGFLAGLWNGSQAAAGAQNPLGPIPDGLKPYTSAADAAWATPGFAEGLSCVLGVNGSLAAAAIPTASFFQIVSATEEVLSGAAGKMVLSKAAGSGIRSLAGVGPGVLSCVI